MYPRNRRFGKSALLAFLFIILSPLTIFSQSNPRIAVVPFNPVGVSEQESKVLTELFETSLVNTKAFQVIEQNRVKEILDVQRYMLSGCTDDSCAVEIGQLLAADRIVLGTVSSVGGKIIVNAKIINVENGENIKADNVRADSISQMTEEIELLAFKLAGLTYTKGEEVQIATAFGDVLVQTDPTGADIFVNGLKKGKSPDLISRIPFGQVKFEARLNDLYASKTVVVAAGTGDVFLKLEAGVYGNLFIKSDGQDVEVYIDEKPMGKIGTGLFKDLPVGNVALTMKGDGVFWSDTVEITEGGTTRVEAYPTAFGTINYVLPEGVEAEVTGPQFRKVIHGSGTLEPVWLGTYSVTVSGEKYEQLTESLRVDKKSTVSFFPDLKFTIEYLSTNVPIRLNETEALLKTGNAVTSDDVEMIRDVWKTVKTYGMVVYEKKADDLFKQSLEKYYQSGIDGYSKTLKSGNTVTEETMAGIMSLKTEVHNANFDLHELKNQIDKIVTEAHQRRELQDNYAEKKALENRIEKDKKIGRGNVIGGIITLSAGVIGGGLCGLFQGLAEVAYNNYMDATVTNDAAIYRSHVETMETISFISAGVGGAGLLGSAILWATKPSLKKNTYRLAEVNARIKELEGSLK